MWLAAVTDRLAFFLRRAGSYAVTGEHPVAEPPGALFDRLQDVLRLAEACPAGPSGDVIRRAACELVEAESSSARAACRHRLLRCVVDVQGRSRPRTDDPSPLLLRQLAHALRRELWMH